MSGFLVVLLKEGLCFSDEHYEEIKRNTEALTAIYDNRENYFYDTHIVCSYKGLNGSQPFLFGSENRYCLLFHGEIFNKNQIVPQIEHIDDLYNGIASLFLEKGTAAFSELQGIFAIVIWDRVKKKLYAARDHFGVKSLYYLENDMEIIISTEKKGVLFKAYDNNLDYTALQHYFSYQYVPEPMTATEGVRKLKAGHYFVKRHNEPSKMYPYFQPMFQPVNTIEKEKFMKETHDVLNKSVYQMIQEINERKQEQQKINSEPKESIGTLLSGGIDSTIIAAIAKKYIPNVKTFSVGFSEQGYSEIDRAKETAEKLGLENISYVITPEECIEVLPKIVQTLEEPFADPAVIPLYIALREAKKHVGTVLSGEGADELFGGYNIYKEPSALKVFEHLPRPLFIALKRFVRFLPEGLKGKSFLERGTTPLAERYIGNAKIFEEEEKRHILHHWDKDTSYQNLTKRLFDQIQEQNLVTQMQSIDLQLWVPGDLLRKAEKMALVNGIQLYLPYLNKDVFEVAKKIPASENVHSGNTKMILREAFKGVVPENVLYRAKLGFPVPIKKWLKNELYVWARQIIQESKTDHILNKQYILQLLELHAMNKGDFSRKVWTALMFMLWHKTFIEQVDEQPSIYERII